MTLTEIWLRRSGFKKVKAGMSRAAELMPLKRKAPLDPALSQQIADLVDRSIRATSLYPSLCLTRALVLDYFLHRYGQNSTIKLGVRTITGEFQAHAWVECDGRELNEREPAHELFTPFDWTSKESGGQSA